MLERALARVLGPALQRRALMLTLTWTVSMPLLGTDAVRAQVPASPASAVAGDAERGRALYVDGRLAGRTGDAAQLRAERANLPAVSGAAAACVQCHRRSGLGDQEGRLRVPPITAASLLAPGGARHAGRAAPGIAVEGTRAQTRPAYTAASLQHVLKTGEDPAGRELNPWMPRYDLDAAAVADLLAYLNRLGVPAATALRGLVGTTLHLATVITPDAAPARREALLTLLPAWARQQRFGVIGVQLHVWALDGAPAQWPQQLQRHWAAQPVYALLSGAGAAQWAPIDSFCEAQALPCLFPLIDRVPPARERYYTAYFSEGPIAEARLAARALAQSKNPPARVQLWVDSDLGLAAAQVFAAQLAAAPAATATDVLQQVQVQVQTVDARAASSRDADADLVISWLGVPQLQARLAHWLAAQNGPRALWLSAHLSPPEQLQTVLTLTPDQRQRLRWVSLRSDPVRFDATASTGLQPWLQTLGLPVALASHEAGEIYAATFFFTDALQRSRGAWTPEHVLERLEAAVSNRAPSGSFVRLSLGPGQRIAAQGGQILGFAPPDFQRLVPLSSILSAAE